METALPRQISTIVRANQREVTRQVFGVLQRASQPIAAAALERVFLTPPRMQDTAEEREFLARGRAERVRVGNTQLAVWSWGEGRTVLFVHGWGSRAARFRVLGPGLVEAGFRVVAFDGPGHGASSGRRSSLPETVRAVRHLACRERERRGALPFAVVAHSFGGAASILAQEDGVRFTRNVLLAPATDFDGYLRRVSSVLGVTDPVVRRMVDRVERRLGFCWDAIRVTDMAQRLDAPALILHDPADADVPIADARALCTAWRGAQLVRTPAVGHRRLLLDDGVKHKIIAFLTDHASTDR
jgi:pimeloyl-ACP methyl ester carboxylesterase